MNFKKDKYSKKYKITLYVGFLILLISLLFTLFTSYSQIIYESGLITIGLVMVIISIIKLIKKRKTPEKDELTRRIADRAAAYSWFFTLIALLIIYWLNFLKVIIFSVNEVIAITYMVMIFTMIFYQSKFWKKGDVN